MLGNSKSKLLSTSPEFLGPALKEDPVQQDQYDEPQEVNWEEERRLEEEEKANSWRNYRFGKLPEAEDKKDVFEVHILKPASKAKVYVLVRPQDLDRYYTDRKATMFLQYLPDEDTEMGHFVRKLRNKI